MNLLVVINSLDLGGAERLVYDQLRLGSTRWDARVVCLDYLGPLAESLMTNHIPVTELGLRYRWDWSRVGRLRQMYREWQPDIVHLHLPRSGFLGRIASIGFTHKVVYTEHNTWDCYSLPSQSANAATYHLNDQVIAVSGAVASSVNNRLGRWMRNGKPLVVPNGIDVDAVQSKAFSRDEARKQLGLRAGDLVVGNVANLFQRKGQKFLIEASRLVLRQVPSARFVLIGSGDQEGPLSALARGLDVSSHVVMTGRIPDAFRLMPAFDVFCLPSLFEGMPISILEAMALGLPVVATKVGGNPEVVFVGMTGLLVPAGEPVSLAGALLRLLTDDGTRRAMGAAARSIVRDRFAINNLVDSYDEVYNKIVQVD